MHLIRKIREIKENRRNQHNDTNGAGRVPRGSKPRPDEDYRFRIQLTDIMPSKLLVVMELRERYRRIDDRNGGNPCGRDWSQRPIPPIVSAVVKFVILDL